MKKFETPEIEIEKFEIADVITTSSFECPEDLGMDLTDGFSLR